jgi:hypothetical protein
MVADRLLDTPAVRYTPSQLSNLLDRSSGAIANACVTLCEQGIAVQVADKPKTYTAAPSKRRGRRS